MPLQTAPWAAGPAPEPVTITAWSTASALGLGADAFVDGLRAGRSGVRALDPAVWPIATAAVMDGFTPSGALGRRGTRAMDRATGIAVKTIGLLLEGQERDDGTGLVLGTSNGSVASMMDFTRDSLTGERPFYVDPARFPNTVMNCAAGQCAIWHGLTGPNTTIAGGHLTGLLALRYATRLARCGYVETVACGAVEELSVPRARLDEAVGDEQGPAAPPGEGCAVFLLESGPIARRHGRDPLADVLAVEVAAAGTHAEPRTVLAGCLRRALDVAGVDAADVWAVAPSDSCGARKSAERAALTDVLGDASSVHVGCAAAVGDTVAASGAFQLAAVLSVARDEPAARGRVAVVTSVDRDGLLGCAVVRTW